MESKLGYHSAIVSRLLAPLVWLPTLDAFRTFCLNPGPEGKVVLEGIQQLISIPPVSPQGLGL